MISTSIFTAAAAALTTSTLVYAQTFTECNPLQRDDCPVDDALGGSVVTDYRKGPDDSVFKLADGTTLDYDPQMGAVFKIENENMAPTIQSHKYMFAGRMDVEVQPAPGAGIVTSIVLQSDCLDEIDWEWVGADTEHVQTNYFSRGNTTTYDRSDMISLPQAVGSFHKYSIEWTMAKIDWLINDNVVRTLTYAEAFNGLTFPQTPMIAKLGTWVAGRKDAPQGTVDWAGGYANFDNGPAVAYYKSISITDYSNGVAGAKTYKYGDRSGVWQSIIVGTDGAAVGEGANDGNTEGVDTNGGDGTKADGTQGNGSIGGDSDGKGAVVVGDGDDGGDGSATVPKNSSTTLSPVATTSNLPKPSKASSSPTPSGASSSGKNSTGATPTGGLPVPVQPSPPTDQPGTGSAPSRTATSLVGLALAGAGLFLTHLMF